ncbi:MAG: type IV toxin-antitoxin system AbiEi family antitoxin domain-containing protein [Solirubrobacteraceae bacterium]
MAREHLKPPDAALVELADRQEGLVRQGDLVALGMTRNAILHRVRTGRLHRLHPGVYALGHRAISRRAQFLAAVWWVGQDAALSHESAAAFYGWITEERDPWPSIHVTTSRNVPSRPGVIVHRTRHLDHRDVVSYGPLLVTDRVRTLVDLADRLTYPELRAVADELPELPKQRLIATSARLPGRAGAGRTKLLIHSEDARTRFALERRYVRYCTHHAVPHPDGRNVRVHGILVDCWYAAARLVVELDSRAHHTRRKEMVADRRRDRALKRHGIDVLRLVWEDLDVADALAAEDVLQRMTAGA